ncbi:unnamed protein product [Rhizoctonia solani]|uniref:Uncharacterized protein n=1 Tax=Rhizoctonia solani TaxID=456999 RepID=A0A8H2XH78_9AGAM|nr:unnamed protein product [Rhizoctonia solani]
MPPHAIRQSLAFSSKSPNHLINKKKEAQGSNGPIHILFENEWSAGNPLFDWYSERSDCTITRIRRCKERKIPYFHEYIMIWLDNGECYRIDRRPYEPMDCAKIKGVAAYDTIKEVQSFEQSSHCSEETNRFSDIEFSKPVQLQLILRILHAIHSHPKARLYSLLLYNCWFFSRAIVFCIARAVEKWHKTNVKGVRFLLSNDYWRGVTPKPDVTDPINEKFPPINGAAKTMPKHTPHNRHLNKDF